MRYPTRMNLLSTTILGLCLLGTAVPIDAQMARNGTRPTPSTQAGAQSENTASISGTVLSASTGEPLRKAHADLSLQGVRQEPIVAVTDDAGHFSIENIQPGRYMLFVEHPSYVQQQYGQDKPRSPGEVITLEGGQKITDLVFRLQQCAAMSGRVIDETGQPIEGVHVEVMRRTYYGGKPQLSDTADAMTDDRGEYRIFDIDPGRYIIRATYAENDVYGNPGAGPGVAYVPLYYPNTIDFAAATPLVLKGADEISGIDFSLAGSVTKAYEVSGRIVNGVTGHSGPGLQVTLHPQDTGGLALIPLMAPVNPRDGTFDFPEVLPGDYQITAMWNDNGQRHATSEDISVGEGGVPNISLTITPGIEISGRVALEGVRDASNMSVILAATMGSFGAPPRAAVQADGTFVLKDVTDGDYKLRIASQCSQCYIKAVTSGDTDLPGGDLRIGSDSRPSSISIVYSGNTAEVAGTVADSGSAPAVGAFVVLVPAADMPNRDDRFETSTTDQYGHFDVRGVVPGHYDVFALDQVDQDTEAYKDPDFLKPLTNEAQPVTLSESDHKMLQLNLISVSSDAQ